MARAGARSRCAAHWRIRKISSPRGCAMAMEAKIYPECIKNYPFVLGAQPLRMIDLAQFYAAIANEGQRIIPYSIESIEQHGHAVYKHQTPPPLVLADGDRAAFYQLRTILEGVV